MASTTSNGAMVRFVNVQKSYDGETLVVKNLNLDIVQGEFVTMLGVHVAEPETTWKLTVTPEGTTSESVTTPEGSVIKATPGWLCVAVYGRVRVDQPAFTVIGPADAAVRFAAIFGPRG